MRTLTTISRLIVLSALLLPATNPSLAQRSTPDTATPAAAEMSNKLYYYAQKIFKE